MCTPFEKFSKHKYELTLTSSDYLSIISQKFSVNPSGLVIQYTDYRELPSASVKREREKISSSRINKQKRIIENACYTLCNDSEHAVPVLVATCPVGADREEGNGRWSEFLRTYSRSTRKKRIENYVWVREYQKNDRPHWHFCAEMPYISYLEMSKYWSGLWGSTARNSIRKPPELRNHFLRDKEASRYLTKYFVKEHGRQEKIEGRKTKCFGMNAELRDKSEPYTLTAGIDSGQISDVLAGKKVVYRCEDVKFYR